MKGRGERKTYSTASKFQRIAREIQKPSYEQFKEIEENNRMGKTRALFKKIRGTKGISYKDWHNTGHKW